MKIKYLTVLCIAIFFINLASAQIKEFTIGDTVPDVLLKNVVLYKKNELRLSDYDNKLIILDFWATWCAPCVKMLRITDSIQNLLDGKVQFIPITNEDSTKAVNYLIKYNKQFKTNIFSVTNETYLWKRFKHNSIPHYVWIDKNKKVIAISGPREITLSKIKNALDGYVDVKTKIDKSVVPSSFTPIFFPEIRNYGRKPDSSLNFSLSESDLISHSSFTRFQECFKGYQSMGFNRVSCTNTSIERLYLIPYYVIGELPTVYINRVVWNVKDSSLRHLSEHSSIKYVDVNDWYRENSFCYELAVPKDFKKEEMYSMMIEDLNHYFKSLYKIKGCLKEIESDCILLKKFGSTSNFECKDTTIIKSNINNLSVDVNGIDFSKFIAGITQFNQNQPPIIDQTNYKGLISMKFDAKVTNIEELNVVLKDYGLELKRTKAKIKMVVIEDL